MVQTQRTIFFITTHNLATNPRIVKEIRLAIEQGFKVKLLAFAFDGWSKPMNDLLLSEFLPHIHYTEISATRKPFLPWFLSTVNYIIAGLTLAILPNMPALLSQRANKRSYLISKFIRKNRIEADLIVAHNPGSFYPAWTAASKNKIALGIDLEDFHEGETNDKLTQRRIKKLIQFILPKAAYISAASPLILSHSIREINLGSVLSFVVENYFNANEFRIPEETQGEKLKLIWFSQHINYGRGLEKIIPVIRANPERFELHVYGNPVAEFVEKELVNIPNVLLFPALPQAILHQKLAQYDIGLALEEKAANANKNFALSNKILAYAQAGLFIIASDTEAQKLFIDQYPNAGTITALDKELLTVVLNFYHAGIEKLRRNKLNRFQNFRLNHWQSKSADLLEIWNQCKMLPKPHTD